MARVRDLEQVGKTYRAQHLGYKPDRMRTTSAKKRRKALRALGDGYGWLSRLAMAGSNLQLITINLAAFKLESLEGESNLYDHAAVDQIKTATLEAMPSAFWARLECGDEERKLHLHLLAHEVPRVAHHAEPVTNLKGMALYLSKAQMPGDDLSSGIYLESKTQARARGKKRLPKTSFSRGIPNA
jgi:hypothetical protein